MPYRKDILYVVVGINQNITNRKSNNMWKNHFKNYILDRGYNYYAEGRVLDLEVEDNHIHASVSGSDDYNVDIDLIDNEVDRMECDCPHALDGNNCKHMAAVLFEFYAPEKGYLDEPSQKVDGEYIKQLIASADEKTLMNFVQDLLLNDENQLRKFEGRVRKSVSDSDLRKYCSDVDYIFNKYSGRQSFISYHEMSNFVMELDNVLYDVIDDMLEVNGYAKAFELTNHIFIRIGNQDMDDSGGESTSIGTRCSDVWEEIYSRSDYPFIRTMFEWFTNNLHGTVIDYMEDFIESAIFDLFDDEGFLEYKLKYVESIIDEVENSPNADEWMLRYLGSRWATRYIMLLKKSGATSELVDSIYKKYWQYSDVRKEYISECIGKTNYREAIKALSESEILDVRYSGLVLSYAKQRKNIYKKMGDDESYLTELWNLIINKKVNDIELYRELKSQYPKDAWASVQDKIFKELKDGYFIAELYQEEGCWDMLMTHIQRLNSIYELQKYEKDLVELYPDEVLNVYKYDLEKSARNTGGRNHYRNMINILKHVQKIKGGREVVEQIVKDWRGIYKRRPAMMEELNRI